MYRLQRVCRVKAGAKMRTLADIARLLGRLALSIAIAAPLYLAVYRPWEIGEQFLAKDKDGNPQQWDPSDIGRILNRYAFNCQNPGIDAQRRTIYLHA